MLSGGSRHEQDPRANRCAPRDIHSQPEDVLRGHRAALRRWHGERITERLESFAILDPHTVAYVDLSGSGIETIAHLRENGRIVIMFCAFEGRASIVRLHGRGEAIMPDAPEFAALAARFPAYPGTRSIIRVHCTRISDSCGFSVPRYEFVGERSQLLDWAERKGPEGLRDYRQKNNFQSIDGLPGIEEPPPD